MRHKFMLIALACLMLAACHKTSKSESRHVTPSAAQKQNGALRVAAALPQPVDLLTFKPVSGAKIQTELLEGWVRYAVEAPGYRRKLVWSRLDTPQPERVTLAPTNEETYREAAWKNINAPRLIMLGIDGMTESLFRAAMKRGDLPAFKLLLEQGAMGPLQSCCEMISPSIWTTIYTGLSPEQHGITNFLGRDPTTGQTFTLTHKHVKAPRLWDIVKRFGEKSVTIGGWLMDPETTVPEPMRDAAARKFAFRRVLSIQRPNLAVVYEEEADYEGHHWWKAMEPKPFRAHGWTVTDAEVRFHGERIAQAYRNLDEWAALALQAAGPETVILISSDHGFQGTPNDPPVTANSGAFADYAAPREFHSCEMKNVNEIMLCADKAADPRPFAQTLRAARLDNGAVPFSLVTDRTMPSFENNISQTIAIRILLNSATIYDAVVQNRQITIGDRSCAVRSFLEPNPSSGGHMGIGLFFIAGQEIMPGARITDASVYDIMPNALTVLGLPIGRDMPGHVWLPAYREQPNVTTIATYGRIQPGGRPTPPLPEELQWLRSLGYIN